MISIQFEIPAKTTQLTPKFQVFDLGVNARFIKQVILKIPEGHKGLAFIKVFSPGVQMIPGTSSTLEYIYGDRQELVYPVGKQIEGVPYKVYCQGYNLDSVLPHSFYLDFYT